MKKFISFVGTLEAILISLCLLYVLDNEAKFAYLSPATIGIFIAVVATTVLSLILFVLQVLMSLASLILRLDSKWIGNIFYERYAIID